MGNSHNAFTVKYDSIERVLKTEVGISKGTSKELINSEKYHNFTAIWDTGATISGITRNVVDTVGLIKAGDEPCAGAHNTSPMTAEVFFINMRLPNDVTVYTLKVIECAGLTGNQAQILIGMDIIGFGDFAVSNFNQKTAFTFRLPSKTCMDFMPPPEPIIPTGMNKQQGVIWLAKQKKKNK